MVNRSDSEVWNGFLFLSILLLEPQGFETSKCRTACAQEFPLQFVEMVHAGRSANAMVKELGPYAPGPWPGGCN